MTNERKDLTTPERGDAAILERVLLSGDLAQLTPAQRLTYYKRVCESLGLNPLTRPFRYLALNRRLVLYATRDAADQLRRRDRISIEIVAREQMGDIYIVVARARTPDGRTDEAIGAVSLEGLKGNALANAIMTAETKAKRRVTLSIAGLGWADESEVGTIPDAKPVEVDPETGELQNSPQVALGEVKTASETAPEPPNGASKSSDTGEAENEALRALQAAREYLQRVDGDPDCSPEQAGYVAGLLEEALGPGATPEDRHAWLQGVCGVPSAKMLGKGQASRLLHFLTQGKKGLDPRAAQRIRLVQRGLQIEAGQRELPMEPEPEPESPEGGTLEELFG